MNNFLVNVDPDNFRIFKLTPYLGNTTINVEVPSAWGNVGETFMANITVASASRLWSLDIALRWNASVLQAQRADLSLGVESHPGGVLHEMPNANVYVAENTISQGEYRLMATSVSPAPPFNGNGTVATVTFKIEGTGNPGLSLESAFEELPLEQNMTDPSPSANPTQSPAPTPSPSGQAGNGPVIPEFPATAALVLFLLISAATPVISKKLRSKS
jgi:hypothetical protein